VHNLVVEALHGEIDIESTLGEGTLVRIRLPVS
jgi:chemotaxis protein histidine kinase CheA